LLHTPPPSSSKGKVKRSFPIILFFVGFLIRWLACLENMLMKVYPLFINPLSAKGLKTKCVWQIYSPDGHYRMFVLVDSVWAF
jgi:hypothetical protein